MEIQIKKPDCRWYEIGQHVKVCCPSISMWQWHPFSITSTPEESRISLYIRKVGYWTRRFMEELKSPIIPSILISEPIGGLPCWIYKIKVMICIGAGIGQTPFIGILKSLWYRILYPRKYQNFSLQKLLYVGISREMESFEWFYEVFHTLENDERVEFYCHVTGALSTDQIGYISWYEKKNGGIGSNGYKDPVTGLKRSKTSFGRPNISQFLGDQKERFDSIDISKEDLESGREGEKKNKRAKEDLGGILYCGPENLSNEIKQHSFKFGYFYHREKF